MTASAAPEFVPAMLYADLAQELAATRRTLERVPDGRSDWRPHEKSMTLGRLATHLAEQPAFAMTILGSDELDLARSGSSARTLPTTAEMLALFDRDAAALQDAMATLDWPSLERTWTMRMGEKVFLSDRKVALIRKAVINHLVHHRAQLGVYLRMLDVPVPSIYGPSADER
ncbi:MAG TPA: DinB family protein [Gemmatimonadaceae bacterium]|jgi:uncharacterized damage-inducible protein DinB|nr:DinB family protein [Gemmatimonadaceae bacterium]